jgi:hypothetical protein
VIDNLGKTFDFDALLESINSSMMETNKSFSSASKRTTNYEK